METQTLAHKPIPVYVKSIFSALIPVLTLVLITVTLSAKNVPGGTIAALWIYLLIPAYYVVSRLLSGKQLLTFSHSNESHSHEYVPGDEDRYIVQSINHHLEHHESPVKKFVKVFWILLVVTLIEVGIAYSSLSKMTMAVLFMFFTIVKAIYIAGTFMHLKDETKQFIWTLVLPVFFLIWFIF